MLGSGGMPPAGYMVAVLALMETPAIIVGLMLARRGDGVQVQSGNGLLHETPSERLGGAADGAPSSSG